MVIDDASYRCRIAFAADTGDQHILRHGVSMLANVRDSVLD